MTKKHFVKVAEGVRVVADSYSQGSEGHDAVVDVAMALAIVFEEANPRFDRRRFLAACGVGATRVAPQAKDAA